MKRVLSLFLVIGLMVSLCLANVAPAMAQTPPADAFERVVIIGDSVTAVMALPRQVNDTQIYLM